jgi:hypothetical protein
MKPSAHTIVLELYLTTLLEHHKRKVDRKRIAALIAAIYKPTEEVKSLEQFKAWSEYCSFIVREFFRSYRIPYETMDIEIGKTLNKLIGNVNLTMKEIILEQATKFITGV